MTNRNNHATVAQDQDIEGKEGKKNKHDKSLKMFVSIK